jgi:hypothetical protein
MFINTLFPVLTPHPALTLHPSDSTGPLTPQGSKGRKEGTRIGSCARAHAVFSVDVEGLDLILCRGSSFGFV